MLTPGADPVRKVSIIPRGPALGVTFSAPDADRYNYTVDDIEGKIKVALGGRAAEEIVFGDITTGAEGDIAYLTTLARYMVGRWGMNEKIGLVAVLPQDGASPFAMADGFSQGTRELMDAEVRRMVDEAHSEVLALLKEEGSRLDALAEALLEQETLDEDDAYAAANVARPQEPALS
jgi:cell division protease FtsH